MKKTSNNIYSPYVFYLRVSKDVQTVETQEEECKKAIRNIEGKAFEYDLYDEEDCTSRIKMHKRPQLMEMLESLVPGQTVVVFKLDRLSRDVIEMVTIYRMIKDKGCKIFSLNDSNCDDEFMIGLMGVLAQKERSDISLRIKAKFRCKRSSGERISRYPPYGYAFCDNGVHFVEVFLEQTILDQMRKLFDEGMSYRGIARTLTDQGHRNRAGNAFHAMTVSRILQKTEETKSLDQLQSVTIG